MNERINIDEEPSCEHCGDLEPYDPTWTTPDEGVTWCLEVCAPLDDDYDGDVTEKDLHEAAIESCRLKSNYFYKKYKEAERRLQLIRK